MNDVLLAAPNSLRLGTAEWAVIALYTAAMISFALYFWKPLPVGRIRK